VAAALIVIEIAAPKVSENALSVLVSACSRAARAAECVLARNASDEQPAAVAIVTLQSEDKIRVEVGVRQGDRDSWRTKDFAFLPADDSMERWRAVGFAIGTLAESNPGPEQETSERAGPATPSSSAASPSSARANTPAGAAAAATASTPSSASPGASSNPPPDLTKSSSPSSASTAAPLGEESETEPKSPEPARPRTTQMFIGAAALFGPGLDIDPPWRLGSALYFDLAPAPMPVFFTVGGSAATRLRAGSNNVTTRWFDVSLGAGVPLIGQLEASGLEFRIQALAEYFDAHASEMGESQSMSRWTLGLQGAFGGRLRLAPNLLLTAEVQAAGLSGETEVAVGGSPVGTSASFRYLGSAGLRVRLW